MFSVESTDAWNWSQKLLRFNGVPSKEGKVIFGKIALMSCVSERVDVCKQWADEAERHEGGTLL